MLVLSMAMLEMPDRSFFEQIYEKYADDVFRRALGILKNTQDAEDVMQNTWTSVAKNMSFFRAKEDGAVRAYLLRIARNQSITLLRERQKEEKYISDADILDVPDEDGVESRLLGACSDLSVSDIRDSLQALPAPYRDILIMFYLHGNSTREIAALLGMNESTVRTRLSRGRERLMRLLERRMSHD